MDDITRNGLRRIANDLTCVVDNNGVKTMDAYDSGLVLEAIHEVLKPRKSEHLQKGCSVPPESHQTRIPMLNISEAASALRIHPETLRRFIREGKIPACKIGKSKFILENEIKKFIQKCSSVDTHE